MTPREPIRPPPRRGARAALAAAGPILAVAWLQLALAMYYWLPDLTLDRALAPTWEALVVLPLLSLAGLRPWPRWALRVVLGLATALVVLALLLGFGQGFARREFGYDVELAIDLQYVPELVRMMWRTESAPLFVFHSAVAVAAVLAAIAGSYLALRAVPRAAAGPAGRRWLGAVGGYLALAAIALGPSGPLTAAVADQLDFAVNKEVRLRQIARALERESALLRSAPLALGGPRPSIYVFVIESYGAAVFDQARFADVRAQLDDHARDLAHAGYAIRSRYMRSPVFGGSSWMADATMLCGVKIKNQKRYASLYETDLECLPRTLGEHGYRTVLAAANTTFVDEKFVDMFPFDRLYLRDDFDYYGPRYSWSYIPDQFVLHALDQREIAAPSDQPLFVFFMLTSSHHPWRRVPPYLERWEELGDGTIFELIPAETFSNNFVTGDAHAAGFAASTRYAMRSVFDYILRLPLDEDPLIIVLGDHQPRKPVADMKTDDWWVPVHVLSRDAALVERFAAQGYVPGVVPDRAVGARGLERLVDQLSAALGPAPAPAREAAAP